MDNPGFFKLVEAKGILTEQDSKNLLRKYKGDAFAVFEYLLEGKVAPAGELERLWGDSIGVSYVDMDKTIFQTKAVRKIPMAFAKEHRVIPIYQMGDVVTIATADPTDHHTIKKAEKLMGSPVNPVFALPKAIEDTIEIQYQTTSALSGFIAKIAEDSSLKGTTQITLEQLKELAEEQSVVEFGRGVIILALRERASDIHIEPG